MCLSFSISASNCDSVLSISVFSVDSSMYALFGTCSKFREGQCLRGCRFPITEIGGSKDAGQCIEIFVGQVGLPRVGPTRVARWMVQTARKRLENAHVRPELGPAPPTSSSA